MRACRRKSLKFSLPFSLLLFVWRLESTTTKSLLRNLHCRSPLFKTLFEIEGQYGRIRRFAVGPVYPNKSLTMCSSVLAFEKYKRGSAFRVSGVWQLAKRGPPITKNFPILRLFPSDAMMAWRFYTPYDVNRTNLHILARNVAHFDSNWPTLKLEKKFVRAGPGPKLENYES